MENWHAWPGKAHCLATFPPTSAKVRWLGKAAFPCCREIHHVYPKICSTESKTFIWGVYLVLVCLTRRKSKHIGDWYIQVGVSDLNPMEPVPQIHSGASCSLQSSSLPSSNHSRSSISLFWPVHCSSSPQMIVSDHLTIHFLFPQTHLPLATTFHSIMQTFRHRSLCFYCLGTISLGTPCLLFTSAWC